MLSIIPSVKQKTIKKSSAESLESLTEVLHKSYKLLKQVARRATNSQLRNRLYTLATEANSCYKDLASLLHATPEKNVSLLQDWNITQLYYENKYDNSEELLNDCSAIENALLRCYRELLHYSPIKHETRRMLQQQFDNLLSSFIQLKMFKMASFSAQ